MSTNPPDPHGQPAAPGASQPPAAPPAGTNYPAPSSSTPAGSYAPPPVDDRGRKPKGPSGLGLVAFIAALAGAVIGAILAFMAGSQFGNLAQYAEVQPDGSWSLDANTVPAEGQQVAVNAALLTFAAFAVWGILALWGLIQGIVAAVRNRGRGWGIAAIVIAVLGVGAVATFYGIGVAAGVAPHLQ